MNKKAFIEKIILLILALIGVYFLINYFGVI